MRTVTDFIYVMSTYKMTCIRAMIHEHEDKHDLRAKDKEMRSPIILRVLADSIILHRFVSLQFSTHYIKDHPNHSSNSCCHLLSQILNRFVQTNKEQKNSPCMQMNDPKACNTLHPMRQFKAGHGRSSTSKRSSEICIMELRERERETKAHGVARLSRIYQSQCYRCCRCGRFPPSGLSVRILSLFSAVGELSHRFSPHTREGKQQLTPSCSGFMASTSNRSSFLKL